MKNRVAGVLTALLFVIVFATSALAGERMEYTVHAGDTRGDIELILKHRGVDIRKMDEWNPGHGMRDMKPGDKLVYYLPDLPAPSMTPMDVKAATEKAMASLGRELAERDRIRDDANLRMLKRSGSVALCATLGILLLWGLRVRSRKAPGRTLVAPEETNASLTQPLRSHTFIKLPNDATPEQIRRYAEETGLESFPISIALPLQGNILVKGGTILKDSHGVLVVSYPGVETRSLIYRRKAAQEYLALSSANIPAERMSSSLQ